MGEVNSNPGKTRNWEADYRQLTGEFDRRESAWSDRERWFYKNLLKLVFRYQNHSDEIDEKLARVREIFRSKSSAEERQAVLAGVVDDCLQFSTQAADTERLDPGALAALVGKLAVPREREFEARQISEKFLKGGDYDQTLAYLKDFIEECINDSAADSESGQRLLPHTVLVQLLDWLLLPVEFEPSVNSLKVDLDAMANEDPVRDTASLLNELHAFLRHDVRDLESYLKNASSEIGGIQMDLTAALESYASVQSATTAFGNRITNGVDDIHAVFDSPSGRDNLKTTIEARLKTMRVAVNEFLDLERERREEYMARSNALTARLKQLESETNDLRSRLEESQVKASVDVLTGVPNRFALEEQFAKELERARRHARPLGCAVLDLDFFKRINDTYGHAAGDKVLRQVAQLCSQNLRTNDFFARYGGEEFVMLLPETEPDAATLVADKLRESVKKVHFHHAGDPVAVTLSVGVAGLREGDTMTSLFERADKALYEAKQAGRDQVKSAPD